MQHLELVDELREVFNRYDIDGDGFMTFTEIRLMMLAVGIQPTEAELHDLIRTVDIDKNCFITFNEFLKFIVPRVRVIESEENLRQVFQVINRSGFGFFDAHDLRVVMANFGEHLTKDESDLLLSDMDTRNTQHIHLDQFLNYLIPRPNPSDFN